MFDVYLDDDESEDDESEEAFNSQDAYFAGE